MTNVATNEVKDQVRALSIVTYSMIFGLILFAGVSYVMIGEIDVIIKDDALATSIATGFLLLAAVVVIFANRFIKQKFSSINESVIVEKERLSAYRTAYIIYLAIREAIGLAGIICFLLTGKPVALLVPLLSIVQMFLHRPTVQKWSGV